MVADLARTVLAADGLRAGLDAAGARLSRATGATVTVALADEPAAGRKAIPLEGPDGPVGALRFPPVLGPDGRELLRRVAPALAALVRTAVERRRLADEALATEALRRSDEVKTTILRATSHDLRTPLTQIAAGAAALRSPSLAPEERDELAADVEQGSDRLSAMIDKLLDLSRLDAGAAHPRAALVALDDLVRDAVDDLAAAAGRVRVDVEEPPPVAWADPVHVTRIVGNLLENALVHGADEPVLVRVVRRRERAVVRVVSAGGGIPRDRLERIFDPFERGDAPAGTGSGLGLAIARGFAEANGGALYAESYPGQGAAFVLELPVAPPAEARP
nr:ATP-binding protein [Patulibacter sp. SYSU D01012]